MKYIDGEMMRTKNYWDWKGDDREYHWKTNFPYDPKTEVDESCLGDLEAMVAKILSCPDEAQTQKNPEESQPTESQPVYISQYERFTSGLLENLEARLRESPLCKEIIASITIETEKYNVEIISKKTGDDNYELVHISVADNYLKKRWTDNSESSRVNIKSEVEHGINQDGLFYIVVSGKYASIDSKGPQYGNSFSARKIVEMVEVMTHAMYKNYQPIITTPNLAKRGNLIL